MDWSLHSAHTSTPSSTCECEFSGCEITQEGFEISDVCSADTGLTQSGLSGRGISSNWHHRIKHLQRAAELIWARDTCKLITPVGKTNRRFIARMISSSLHDLSEVYPVALTLTGWRFARDGTTPRPWRQSQGVGLLVPQRHHGIDLGRAPGAYLSVLAQRDQRVETARAVRRQITRYHCHEEKNQRSPGETQRVARTHPIERPR